MKYLLATLLLLFTGCTTNVVTTDNQVFFQVLTQGQTSGLTQQKFLTLRSAAEFAELWDIHTRTNSSQMPKINFQEQMVIAVFMGEQRTGGYAIRIEKIIEHQQTLQVNVLLIKPKPGSVRIMMISQPNMMVTLPRSNKPVSYEFRTNH